MGEMGENVAKILAYSPGRYPILVVESPPGELQTFYYETGYDPECTGSGRMPSVVTASSN
jgi:hypothetical protein